MEQISLNKIKENQTIEFKNGKGGFPNSFLETYSAFSNTNGGTIYLGIIEDSDKSLTPSKLTEDDIYKLKQTLFSTLNNKNKVSTNLLDDTSIIEKEFHGFPVLEIHVLPSPKEYKPVFVNGNILTGSYRRNFEGDYRCSPSEIKSMLLDASSKSQDLNIVEEASLDDLSMDSINSYRNLLSAHHPEHIFLKKNIDEFLLLLGACIKGKDNNIHPTVAGLLMFGYSYKTVFTFPEYFLDYQEHYTNDGITRWSDRVESDSGTWSGNLFDFYLTVSNKLTKDLKIPFMMNKTIRIDETNIHKALREGLCNCICNANFYESRGIVIKKYYDRIEFYNPGCLRMNPTYAFKGGESDARNKTIQKMFSLVGIGERAGSGLPLILDMAIENKFQHPTLEDYVKPERTKLVIYLKESEAIQKEQDTKDIDSREKKILNAIKLNGTMKAKDIALEINESLSTTKYTLYKIVDKGMIQAIGNSKNRKYCLYQNK